MATRFAVASTSWNTPSTWDNGAVPLPGDTVYPNGFSVTIDTDISVASLNNNTPPVYLPNMNIPAMTSNTQPSGIADSSGYSLSYYPYLAFDQNSGTTWASNSALGWLTYNYGTNKLIKRYYIKQISLTGYSYPTGWIFEGWNTTTNSWDPLESKSAMGTTVQSTGYLSPILTHTALYSIYRLNIQTTNNVANVSLTQFEMTESVSTSYGTGTGGSFTVPSSLVGTRNIEFSGDGIRIAGSTTCINIAATTGATVNFNRISGGEIFKPIWSVSNGTNGRGVSINGNCAVVFNGNIQGTTANAYNDGGGGNIYINAAATVTINGNVIAPTISPTYPSYLIQSAATTSNNAILNINGNIVSGLQITTYALYLNGINTVNLIGNITATQGYAISATTLLYLNITGTVSYTNASSITPIVVTVSSIINITGAVTAPPNATAINCQTGAVTINVPTGIVTAGTNAVGISAPSATLVTIGNSPLINTNGYMAVAAPRIRLYSPANVQWVFQDNIASNKVLYSAGGSIGLPLTTNVRNNIQYGASNELTGTMIVPTNPNVRMGVQVDVQPNVGTADLTAQDIFTAIATSPDPVAERLRNVSTVQTTGDQLAAF